MKTISVTKSQGGQNIIHTIKKGKVNWIGHMLRRNWLLKHVIKVKKIDITESKTRKNM